MHSSDWPLRFKIYAVVLFVAIMLVARVAITWFVDAAPKWITDYMLVAGLAFCLGWLGGERSIRRAIEARDRDFERSGFGEIE
jgi:hypothetical protein